MPRLKSVTDANGTKIYPITITRGVYDTDKNQRLNETLANKAENTVMGASGSNHAKGLVPDPGATAGTTKYLREDGTWQTPPNDNTISQGYCETAAATQTKIGDCTNYNLLDKSYLMVNLKYSNTYAGAITLNVNNAGAKPIYINGEISSSTNYTLPAGSYLVYYEDNKYYFRTDGKISGQGVVSPDGSSLDMQVDEAINLVGETSKEDTFLYRPTADHIHIYPDAKIESIKGNTVVWNQLVQNGNFASMDGWNNNPQVSTSASDNTAAITVIAIENPSMFVKQNVTFINEHKYYVQAKIKLESSQTFPNNANVFYGFLGSPTKWFPAVKIDDILNKWKFYKNIVVSSGTETAIHFGAYKGANTYNFVKNDTTYLKDCMCIDLTLMFGAGNEPSTVEEFEEWLADNVGLKDYYPYNEGELIPCKTTGIKTVGFNLFDPTTATTDKYIMPNTAVETSSGTTAHSDFIPIFPNTQYYCKNISSKSSLAGVIYYNANKEYIGYGGPTLSGNTTTSGLITTPSNARYCILNIRISDVDLLDVCFSFHHSGSRDGEYESYWTETKQIPITSLTGKLNGEGSSVVVFPDGMKKAGNVCDEIKGNKAVKRIGSMDLGTLTWNYDSTSGSYPVFYAYINSLSEKGSKLICEKYIAKYGNWTYFIGNDCNGKIGAPVTNNPYVIIQDSTYSDAATFKTAMAGVLLYYELETPEEYILDTFELPLDYHVDDYGTEEQLLPTPTTNELTSCTANLNITYGINARDSIRRLPYNYVSAVLKLNFTESLKALARRNIGVLLADEDPSLDNIALIEDGDSSLVYITDKQGNRVLPITHIDSVRDSNGNPLSSLLPQTMGASGSNHSGGLVPDTPSTSGTTKFLREDGTWAVPADIDTNTTYKFTIGSTTNGDSTNGVSLGSLDSETAVADGTDLSLVTTGEKAIWNSKTSNEGTVTGITVGTGGTNYTPTNGVVTIPAYPTTLPASDVSSWAKADNKPSYAYSEIGYTVNPVSNSSTTLSLDGTTPIHVVTTTAAITSLTLSQNPSEGHSCHVILTASTDKSVTIPANLTNVVYPDGEGPIDLEIPAGGYVEVDFIMSNNKVYVRAIL